MAWRFNPPPGWPTPPEGWVPPPGWTPDPSWPPPPPGWQLWVEEPGPAGGPVAGAAGTPPTGTAQRRGSGLGKLLLVIVVILVGFGVVVAAVSIWAFASRESDSQEFLTEAETANVRIRNECGSITLLPGPAGAVSTRASLRYAWRKPSITSEVSGSAVVVEVDCPAFWAGSSVSLEVSVPPDGTVDADTSAGSVKATGLSSDLDLRSSAGSITATELTSASVAADTSAGSVTLSWAEQADPTRIRAHSSAGSVTVRVPDLPAVAYRVEADTSAGSTTVTVRTDPDATRTIEATSSAGSVVVDYR